MVLGVNMRFFSGCLPFPGSLIFLFLPVAYLPFPVAPVLPSLFFFFLIFVLRLLSSLSLLLSFLLLLLPFFLLLLFLPWLLLWSLPFVHPPAPSVARLSISLASLLAFVVSIFFFLSLFFRRISLAVCRLFLPFSCRLFLYFFPIFSFWVTPALVTCAFVSITSFAAPVLSLLPPHPLLFFSFLCLLRCSCLIPALHLSSLPVFLSNRFFLGGPAFFCALWHSG